MKKLAVIIGLLFSASVLATEIDTTAISSNAEASAAASSVGINIMDGSAHGYAAGNTNGAYNSLYNANSNSNGGTGVGGSSFVVGGSTTVGGSALTAINQTNVPRQVAAIGLTTPMSTAQCRHSIGSGIAGATFSFLLNMTFLDEGCDVWRDVENLLKMDEREAALKRACDKPETARALGEVKCPTPPKSAAVSKEWNGGE